MRTAGEDPNAHHFDPPSAAAPHQQPRLVRQYLPALTPHPSSLRPHVGAKERLQCWTPSTCATAGTGHFITLGSVSEAEKTLLANTFLASWDESTRSTYGAGLLVFHVFCDRRNTPEEDRAPASPDLIKLFIASVAGAYSAKTISNYMLGVRAWHKLHGLVWLLEDGDLDTLLRAAQKKAPPSSKRKQRQPITPEYIEKVKDQLDLSTPLHAAAYACLTTTFYAAARLGEFTIPTLKDFDPARHVKPSGVRQETDRNGNIITVFAIPRTKTKVDGEDILWATQEGPTDPSAAWINHVAINAPPDEAHLFAYWHRGTHRPLTKPEFLKLMRAAALQAGLQPFQGHSIRIGATLEYMLRGLSFEAMKAKGRWSSDAFHIYLTQHAQILAPYIQSHP